MLDNAGVLAVAVLMFGGFFVPALLLMLWIYVEVKSSWAFRIFVGLFVIGSAFVAGTGVAAFSKHVQLQRYETALNGIQATSKLARRC